MSKETAVLQPHSKSDSEQTTGTFHLRISFAGLCMYVPKTTPPQDSMYVLMPYHGHADHDGHLAMLMYGKGSRNANTDPGTEPDDAAIDGCEVSISATAGQLSAALERRIANLTHITDRPVKPEYLTSPPGGDLAARFVLQCGGPGDYGDGAFWQLGEVTRELSHIVHWDIPEVAAPSLKIRLAGSSNSEIELYPHQGRLDIWVLNVPASEKPTTFPPREPSPRQPDPSHFMAFYKLLETGDYEPKPEYRRPPRKGIGLQGVSPFTCMGAGGGG